LLLSDPDFDRDAINGRTYSQRRTGPDDQQRENFYPDDEVSFLSLKKRIKRRLD
jgi:hypothetical protein